MSALTLRTAVLIGLAIAFATPALAAAPPALPDVVAKAFKAQFPQGKITDVETETENGVTAYAIDFTDGKVQRSADIASDGTVLEVAQVVQAKDVPEAAMKSIQKEAAGAKIARIERAEVTHQTHAGAVSKLPATVVQFEVELTKKNAKAEVVVSPDGTVLESADWD